MDTNNNAQFFSINSFELLNPKSKKPWLVAFTCKPGMLPAGVAVAYVDLRLQPLLPDSWVLTGTTEGYSVLRLSACEALKLEVVGKVVEWGAGGLL